MTVCISGNDYSLERLLDRYGHAVSMPNISSVSPKSIKLMVFPGGADISPNIYGHTARKETMSSEMQDFIDEQAFYYAQNNGIPCVGICRGAQFLVAKAGGFLYQHVLGHGQSHRVTTLDGEEFKVTSSHHQMFGEPLPPSAQLLAWATRSISTTYEVGEPSIDTRINKIPSHEQEAVYLPSIKSLAVQWHPEWMDSRTRGYTYFFELIDTLLLQQTELFEQHV